MDYFQIVEKKNNKQNKAKRQCLRMINDFRLGTL